MIKLSEAYNKLKTGDKFDVNDGEYILECVDATNFIIHDPDKNISYPIAKFMLNDQLPGEIIPAEPKVMTFDEWIMKQSDDPAIYYRDDFEVSDLKECAEFFQKNGRLEMWLDFEKKYKKMVRTEGYFEKYSYSRCLEELKPEYLKR